MSFSVWHAPLSLNCLRPSSWPASCAAADTPVDEATTTSWAEGHPELLEIFGRPFASQGIQHRKATFRFWSSQEIPTKFASSPPTLVRGPKNQLIAHCWSTIARSTDGGSRWTSLGSPPRGLPIPEGFKQLSNSFDGCGITARGTLLAHLTVQYNDGRPYEGVFRSQLPRRPVRHSFDRRGDHLGDSGPSQPLFARKRGGPSVALRVTARWQHRAGHGSLVSVG